MSPAPIAQDATALPSPLQPAPPAMLPPQLPVPPNPQSSGPLIDFDDTFNQKFMEIIEDFKNNPTSGQITQVDRKEFIFKAYSFTDALVFANRQLSDRDIKMRALTKLFYKVLAEEPWSEEWIRPHDVERKLSRFELHKDSVMLAAQHDLHTPQDAIKAARIAQEKAKDLPEGKNNLRGPFDDIELLFIPGTVSSTATNAINRESMYPVSASSVANVLLNHVCRKMTRPYVMAQKFVECNDPEELFSMRKFARDVCDFAPHLLDNDNVSLLIVLLILSRSEICRRFEENGIRIEGSTVSHRRSECMKNKLGWRTFDERKPFDVVSADLQSRIKTICCPGPRSQRVNAGRKRKISSLDTPGVHRPYTPDPFNASNARCLPKQPPIALYPVPKVRPANGYNGSQATNGLNHANSNGSNQPPRLAPAISKPIVLSEKAAGKQPVRNEDAMDIS